MCQSNSSETHGELGSLPPDHATLYMPLVDHKTTSNDESPVFESLGPAQQLTLSLIEAKSILSVTLPMVLTGLLLYSRSLISMLFLGRLGSLPLAGGSLAIGFANITGYSVLSGLATGMEPICGQAYGAGRHHLLGLALRRTILLLLCASLPICLLWLSMRHILILCGQNTEIAEAAQSFILFSLPDLFLQSFLHPIRVYFRTQSITLPLTVTAAATVALHFPINYLLINHFHLGIPGVALASVLTNFNLLLLLIAYLHFSGVHLRTGGLIPSADDDTFSLSGWRSLIALAVPSCFSVCLEWWWYEIMVLLCGLLLRPQATVASMGLLIQTTSLIYIFPSSLSVGVSTRVSNELGANRPDRARRAAGIGLFCGALLGLTAFSFSLSVRNIWAKIFTADAEIVSLTATVLPILGLCELGNCPQTTGCGVLRGSARPRTGAHINLGSFYGVGMPIAVGLAFWARLDFSGLWLGLLAAQLACLVLMLGVIARTDWTRQAERAQSLTGGQNVKEQDCKPIIIKIEQCDSLVF
ncbi:protein DETOXIFICATION 49-like [Phalaenopsis equestris]|uniref:protein DETOXIFICATION 49-like n=1 Tax=Phalaenopsis equestris TaxID=78828 RepID=UPI0009E2C31B|nr:protein DETOXIFICATION 49-like [Phalaenopsis equestris]